MMDSAVLYDNWIGDLSEAMRVQDWSMHIDRVLESMGIFVQLPVYEKKNYHVIIYIHVLAEHGLIII
jgi:hypothetical protein